jgi:hypothetical protein
MRLCSSANRRRQLPQTTRYPVPFSGRILKCAPGRRSPQTTQVRELRSSHCSIIGKLWRESTVSPSRSSFIARSIESGEKKKGSVSVGLVDNGPVARTRFVRGLSSSARGEADASEALGVISHVATGHVKRNRVTVLRTVPNRDLITSAYAEAWRVTRFSTSPPLSPIPRSGHWLAG